MTVTDKDSVSVSQAKTRDWDRVAKELGWDDAWVYIRWKWHRLYGRVPVGPKQQYSVLRKTFGVCSLEIDHKTLLFLTKYTLKNGIHNLDCKQERALWIATRPRFRRTHPWCDSAGNLTSQDLTLKIIVRLKLDGCVLLRQRVLILRQIPCTYFHLTFDLCENIGRL